MPIGEVTGQAVAALPGDARAGVFGKLPARGDFVRENLPREFTDPWDAWWQRGLADTQRLFGDDWRAAWLEAPVWRFVLPPGLCGGLGVLGIWMPSVDKVGRYYPLTIAATSPGDWASYVGAMTSFLAAAEDAGRDALEHDLAPSVLLQRVEEAFVPADTPGSATDFAATQAAWWTEGGVRVDARTETGAVLPGGSRFAALIDDGWAGASAASEPAADGAMDAS